MSRFIPLPLPRNGRPLERPAGILFIGLLLFTFSGGLLTPARAGGRESISEQDSLRPFLVVIASTPLVHPRWMAPAGRLTTTTIMIIC